MDLEWKETISLHALRKENDDSSGHISSVNV